VGFGREEGDEEVLGVGDPRAVVLDHEVHAAPFNGPADANAAAVLARGVDGVLEEVDKKLIELVGVAEEGDVGAAGYVDRKAALEQGGAAYPFADIDELGLGGR